MPELDIPGRYRFKESAEIVITVDTISATHESPAKAKKTIRDLSKAMELAVRREMHCGPYAKGFSTEIKWDE